VIRQEFIEDIGTPSQRRYWVRLWRSMSAGLARQASRRIARKIGVGQASRDTGTYEEYIENYKEGG